MPVTKETVRSSVRIRDDGSVAKAFHGEDAAERFQREADALRYLERAGCPFVPRLLEADEENLSLVTTNCGKTMDESCGSLKTLALFKDLREKYGVAHGDETVRNATIDPGSGRVCIVNFENAVIEFPLEREKPHAHFEWCAMSKKGTRHRENDDSLAIFACRGGKPESLPARGDAVLDRRHVVFAVSDGMGGGNAGDVASQAIVTRLQQFLPRTLIGAEGATDEYFLSCLLHFIEEIHTELNAEGACDPSKEGMGATLSLCWFSPGQVYCAHVGDSRIYIYREGELTLMTEDDTYAYTQLRDGEISEALYREHPRRNVLYEALGGQHSLVTPQFFSESYEPGDRFLLCTDGLIDGLWESDVLAAFAEGGTVAGIATRMMDKAQTIAGDDDTTLVVIEAN